jgi:formylglycine-generating enzyme required for sulfatase activity
MTGEHPFKNKDPVAARKAGLLLTRPPQLGGREFRALRHGLEFDRDLRSASAAQFLAEFNGGGSRRGWLLGAAACLVLLAALAVIGIRHRNPAAPATSIAQNAMTPAVGQVFRDCPTCPLMKVLPAGDFLQGSSSDDVGAQQFEMPQHKASIAHPFAAGVYEVTVGEFSEFVADTHVEAHACSTYDGEWRLNSAVSWKNAFEAQVASHPVSCVSWQDAKDYAAWLSHRTNQDYRLLSASEWEYAARAGAAAQRPWTDPARACAYANVADETAAKRYAGWSVMPCTDNFVQAAPVGSFAANPFGLYDMLGNVFEWTEDCWTPDYQGAPVDGSARTDGDCSQRELRGGSWFTQPEFVRTAYRDRFASDYRSTTVGFRLRREISK